MKRLHKVLLLITFCLLLGSGEQATAQCAMCRRAAESSMEKGENKGRGLNAGILYLMSVPYLMGGVAGLIWWKHRKRN